MKTPRSSPWLLKERRALALLLVGPLGLHGVWIAMCVELCVRGLLFLLRMLRGRWLGMRAVCAE